LPDASHIRRPQVGSFRSKLQDFFTIGWNSTCNLVSNGPQKGVQGSIMLVCESNEEVLTLSPFSNKVVYDEEREDGLSTGGTSINPQQVGFAISILELIDEGGVI
jgi:hypothetical protein